MTLEINAGPQMRRFAETIADRMVELFSITRDEAVARINRHWWHVEHFAEPTPGNEIKSPTLTDLIMRESPTYWAKTVYYGEDVAWWKGEEGLEPLPYP